ncbi:hypothetical protein G9A89_022049 [Geosiphon pyriformis]|nr:hypothetical protein G9A89_022049 [Geosiphon pyriformis]
MIYMIPEKKEPINNSESESESLFNSDSNSDNDDNKNNDSSSIQIDHKNYNDSNFNSNPKTYITLLDLTKEQKLKWFSNNNESIMPEHAHNTDVGFDLRYLEKDPIKLELHLYICIDLKIALEIPATTIVQLASKSSLAKKGINIRREIINAKYVKNIIAMLQNNSEKTYIINSNEKIAQAIFLSLMKIAQLVLVKNKKKLGITAREIQEFGSTDRIEVPVNMAEKKIVDKGEIIFTHQPISIPPYNQYMVTIERKVKDQVQIFEAEATLCESGKIGLVNLHIPAKNYDHIKIPIYNTTENIIEIPKRIIIRYLTMKVEDQPPNYIPDFLQLCEYTKQMLSALTRTIGTDKHGKSKLTLTNAIKNRAYKVPPASHEIIHQEINQILNNKLIQPSIKRNWENSWKDTSTIDPIESLSIIQKTSSKPSDTTLAEPHPRKTSTDNTKPKVTKSENIETNHLEFAKSLFQHYCQYLGLNHNHISTESVFNFYVNEKISSLLKTPVNTESARETFYKELIQNTNLSTNHNFTSIITEINKEIKHHTQQRYPITYASKGKGKLQIPAQPILPLYIWKHHQHIINRCVPINYNINFGISDLWEATESEKEEEESEDQEFTYQHLITENPEVEIPNFQTQQNLNLENSEIKTPNHQRQNNPNSELINHHFNYHPNNQYNNNYPMVYAPIVKLNNFTGEENDTQVWLNDVKKAITSLVNKPQDFNAFKVEFLRYFSNNNSINRLVNTFTTMKQEETEVILNQFICSLCSSILQHVHPLHPDTLQDAVTHTRDFESTKSETNHKFNELINKRLEGYLVDNHAIYQPLQRCNNQRNSNYAQNQPCSSSSTNQQWQQKMHICHYCKNQYQNPNGQFQTPNQYPNQNQPAYLLVMQSSPQVIYQQPQPQIIYQPQQIQTPPQNLPPNRTQRPRITQQSWRLAMVVHQLISSSLQQPSGLCQRNSGAGQPQNLNSQNYLSFLVTSEDTPTNNLVFAQKQPLTSNISPTTITKDKFLAAIFPFKFKETTITPLFSKATLEAKPITTIYTDTKVEEQFLKLIFDSGSTGSIIIT